MRGFLAGRAFRKRPTGLEASAVRAAFGDWLGLLAAGGRLRALFAATDGHAWRLFGKGTINGKTEKANER
jgi:hypothetical protein